ncbi:MAG: type I-C CRISPR-associated protein Cas5c [Synergistaceae bacterium]|jgi:CRISPR-associated protein Cas5d|nr:type I-C CRISPR-associated protein Cas5c [Synergistaceae bacterium]
MGYGIKLLVWGDLACFSRPEMKAERVSYDAMTPSAAVGILSALHRKPAIKWRIDRIHVLKEIKFTNIRRNEVENKIPVEKASSAAKGLAVDLHQYATAERQQRATLMLHDVKYLIEAHFEMTDKAGESDTPAKHYNIFLRRARSGSCFHTPCFGLREFPANFRLFNEEEYPPLSYYRDKEEIDLGYMLHSIDYSHDMRPRFFRAKMCGGVIDVPEVSAL